MTRRVRIGASAREELRAAFDWYEERSPGLGADFLTEIESAVVRIARQPGVGAPVPNSPPDQPARRHMVRRFPYAVVCVPTADEVLIVAFAHTRRRPGYWRR